MARVGPARPRIGPDEPADDLDDPAGVPPDALRGGYGAAGVLVLAVAGLLAPGLALGAGPGAARGSPAPGAEPATRRRDGETAKGGRAASSVPAAPKDRPSLRERDPAGPEAKAASGSTARPGPFLQAPRSRRPAPRVVAGPSARRSRAARPGPRGGERPTREDFEAVARTRTRSSTRTRARPGSRAIESTRWAGSPTSTGRDDEALRLLLVAQARREGSGGRGTSGSSGARSRPRPGERWHGGLGAGPRVRRRAAGGGGSPREGPRAGPADPRALLGRAVLRRMERRSAEAIADATSGLRAAARRVLSGRGGGARRRRARFGEGLGRRGPLVPEGGDSAGPASAHAGWEGGRILEERLGRPDEARELYAVACRAGNRKACLEKGEPAPRPKRFPRRRGP